jgi:hypothetical protein
MNYWKQFAEMLGVELGEEFVITDSDGKRKGEDMYKITEDGILYQREKNGLWLSEPLITLYSLLNGSYKAVPKPWKPKFGEQYWSYSARINKAICDMFGDFVEDYAIWKSGNCFKTKEEAETKGKEIVEKLLKEYEEA